MTDAVVDVQQVLARLEAMPPQADAVQWRYVCALAQRLQAAAPTVQAVLAKKLTQALDHWSAAAEDATGANDDAQTPCEAAPSAGVAALSALNQHIASASAPSDDAQPLAWSDDAPRPLKSAARFQEVWALISAEAQVDLASFRAPSNAGPLNAHRLVLQVLAQMRDLSPDYLRHCLNHVDTLMWLDQAYSGMQSPAAKSPASKTARKTASTKRKR